jgi:hypothetical protein
MTQSDTCVSDAFVDVRHNFMIRTARNLRLAILSALFLGLVACGGGGSKSASTNNTNDRPPTAPVGISAAAADSEVVLTWNSVSNATNYNVYWAVTSGVTKLSGTRISNASSPHTVSALTNGTSYYYVITAQNAQGESGESSEVSAIPQVAAPGQVTGVTVTPLVGGLQVSWNAVGSASGYNLYWSTSPGVTPLNGTAIQGVTSPHILSPLTAGTSYYVVVTAENAGGEGQPSTAASATPDVPVAGWTAQELINIPFDFFDTDLYLGDVDINDDGAAAAVWVEEGSDRDTARVKVNRYVNGAWGSPELLAGPSAFSPNVVVAPNGDVIVSYMLRGFDPDGFWLNATVWSRRYANGAWSAAEQIDGADLAAFIFMHGMDLASDGGGNVVASWIEDNAVIWVNRYDAASDSWGTPAALSNSVRLVQEPALGADSQGRFTVVWLQDTQPYDPGQTAGGPRNPTLYSSRYDAGAWGAAAQVGHTDIINWEGAERVDLAVNADGTAVAVWEQTRDAGGGDTDWSVDTVRYDPLSDTWGTPETIYSQSIYTSWPDVAVDGLGNAIVTWQPTDPIDNSQRIASASFYDAVSATWGPVQTINVDDGVTDVDELNVGKDAAGNAIAVWMQSGEIKARHYDAVSGTWSAVTPIGLRDGIDLTFAMSSTGRAITVSNPLDMSPIPFTRGVWANVFTP